MGRKPLSVFLSVVTTLIYAACSNALIEDLNILSEKTPPVCTFSPAEESTINNQASITVSFSETISPDSLVLNGSMSGESDGGTWNVPDYNILIIRPISSWSDGSSSLIIDCKDTAGNSMLTTTVNYMVDSTIPAVSSISPDLETNPYIIASTAETDIEVQFNKDMNKESVSIRIEGGTAGVLLENTHYTISWPDISLLKISPVENWIEDQLTLTINGNDSSGNILDTYQISFLTDLSPPVVDSISPVTDSILETADTITVSFSEPVDISSLSISGSLISSGYTTSWNSGHNQLIITPSPQWNIGPLQNLNLNVEDDAGNPISSFNKFYDVAVIFVTPTGNDDNSGTRTAPKKTISNAVNYADSQYSTAEVLVAEGTYEVSYQTASHIVLKEGISLYGGYSAASWGVRNPDLYISEIKEISTSGGGSSIFDYQNMNRAIEASGSISRNTVVDGFTIDGGGLGSQQCSSALYIFSGASPTITNNIIKASRKGLYMAVMADSSNADFNHNEIYASIPTYMSWTFIVSGVNTGTFEFNNNIFHGSNITATQGVRSLLVISSDIHISNNIITGGTYQVSQPFDDSVICLEKTDSDTVIENNIITGPTGTARVAGIEINSGNPVVRNNIIHLPDGIFSINYAPSLMGIKLGYASSSGSTTYPSILNNTFILGDADGGSSTTSAVRAIYAHGSSGEIFTPRIENNIFYAKTGVTDEFEAVVFSNCDTTPNTLKNNCFYNFVRFYFDSNGRDYQYVDNFVSEYGLNDLNTDESFASGNIYRDPSFQDFSGSDFHLKSNTDQKVRLGGLTLSEVTEDLDGVVRTDPYSIGAYEQD